MRRSRVTTPEVMDEQMGLLFPALRDDRLRAYARVMQEEAEAYVAGWGDEGEVDLLAALNELTVFIAFSNFATRSNTALGIESQGFSAACEIPPAALASRAWRG